jgi:hypothetical protein
MREQESPKAFIKFKDHEWAISSGPQLHGAVSMICREPEGPDPRALASLIVEVVNIYGLREDNHELNILREWISDKKTISDIEDNRVKWMNAIALMFYRIKTVMHDSGLTRQPAKLKAEILYFNLLQSVPDTRYRYLHPDSQQWVDHNWPDDEDD